MFSSSFESPSALLLLFPLLTLYVASKCLYNIFLHPLRSFPGPLSARASILAYHRKVLQGQTHKWVHDLHKRYGPVVRIAPNELSFNEADVWKDVYGHRASSFQKAFVFYGPDIHGNPPGILRADNASHARQRKMVSHAFSDKALRSQEQMLKGYAGLLIQKLRDVAASNSPANIVEWYNFTTFDIMADLTFGEPLHQLTDSSYHPWVKAIFSHLKALSISRVCRAWPGLTRVLRALIPKDIKQKQKQHLAFAAGMIDRRMELKTEQPDIWNLIARHSEEDGGLAPSEMHSNGALFMLAGTETTATQLSGLTYILLRNPDRMKRLVAELRSSFSSFEDMTMTNLSQLEYLGACIDEGLRLYPPVPVGIPREVPEGGASVCGQWVPGGATVYAVHHSSENFTDPDSFIPERFLPEGKEKYGGDRREALNAFSHGPRNCVGKNLAYHEMRLILASVLFHFDLELFDTKQDWLQQESHAVWDKKPLQVKFKTAV
ncbi:hypothetical protein E8E13_009274 [Curvularia kusanoi]|uniref:Cytochrome P450 n=1 Tax=Curvularia kusanoi TaxID=90978 RepID=A0A9P4TGC6_CURKU|nr:hypothetical protein E8E13_009274 [Curvularia kusanoi]